MIDTVLFDLDGTLLPMDQEEFVKKYMGGLAAKMAPYGYEPKKLVEAVWKGTGAMMVNDGSRTNEEVFWETFRQVYGADGRKDEPVFYDFYIHEFAAAKEACGFAPEAAEVIGLLKEKGLTVVLATNPLFPAIATQQRIRWAGLEPEDFALVTTYENSSFCKPNSAYYRQILEKIGKAPENCLMVGNDVGEDMVAGDLGMQVFLLTPCLINRKNADISGYAQGGFAGLKAYLEENL